MINNKIFIALLSKGEHQYTKKSIIHSETILSSTIDYWSHKNTKTIQSKILVSSTLK